MPSYFTSHDSANSTAARNVIAVRHNGFHQRVSVVSDTAAHQQSHSAVVRRYTGRLDHMHVVLSDPVMRRLHVFAFADGQITDSLAGDAACDVARRDAGVSQHSAIDRMEAERQ